MRVNCCGGCLVCFCVGWFGCLLVWFGCLLVGPLLMSFLGEAGKTDADFDSLGTSLVPSVGLWARFCPKTSRQTQWPLLQKDALDRRHPGPTWSLAKPDMPWAQLAVELPERSRFSSVHCVLNSNFLPGIPELVLSIYLREKTWTTPETWPHDTAGRRKHVSSVKPLLQHPVCAWDQGVTSSTVSSSEGKGRHPESEWKWRASTCSSLCRETFSETRIETMTTPGNQTLTNTGVARWATIVSYLVGRGEENFKCFHMFPISYENSENSVISFLSNESSPVRIAGLTAQLLQVKWGSPLQQL